MENRRIPKTEYPVESMSSSQGFIQYLDDRIYDYNSNVIQKQDGEYFSKRIRDSRNNVIAGVSGWTWANACEILTLWVKEEYRQKGLGKKLLRAAELEAIQKKCGVILIRSYSFQAPLFYHKRGYKIEHILDNFPDGHKYYILVKRIAGK
jgi:ribosomal protein S18 acetylase RimI-like enzyme